MVNSRAAMVKREKLWSRGFGVQPATRASVVHIQGYSRRKTTEQLRQTQNGSKQ
jgi:hypothetical protein